MKETIVFAEKYIYFIYQNHYLHTTVGFHLSKTEQQEGKFLEELKLNYKRRIQAVDAFSKHFSLTSSDFRSQYLNGILDILQYYVDLQTKFSMWMPMTLESNLMIPQSKIITETWTQATRNMDLVYAQFVNYFGANMRLYNQVLISILQNVERFYDMNENVPQIQRDILIKIIKDERKLNDTKEQKQPPILKSKVNTKNLKNPPVSKSQIKGTK